MEESVVLDLPIIGNKIGIRKFQVDDYQGIRTWVNNKIVTQDLMDSNIFDHFHSEQETNDFLTGSLVLDYSNIRLVIADKISNKYLGQLAVFNFSNQENNCEIDIILANPDIWDNGIGSEAIMLICNNVIKAFKLKEIYAKIKKCNKRALKCAIKSGFKIKNNDLLNYTIVSLMNI